MTDVNLVLPLMLSKCDRQDVHDACQDDAKGDDIDVKQVVEHLVE